MGFTDVRKDKKRLQLEFCCTTRGETRGLSLREQRGGRRSVGFL